MDISKLIDISDNDLSNIILNYALFMDKLESYNGTTVKEANEMLYSIIDVNEVEWLTKLLFSDEGWLLMMRMNIL